MAEALEPATVAFDSAAASYDTEFSDTVPGHWLRELVWSRLSPHVRPGMKVLDLGCGTGDHALWFARRGCRVTAVDKSRAMLVIAARKAEEMRDSNPIATVALDIENTKESGLSGEFDLVLSNFGAINCIQDLLSLRSRLQSLVSPGGIVALNFMGRFCAWESAYYFPRARATRRWRGRAAARVGSSSVDVKYWSVGQIRRALAPEFRVLALSGIGVLLPPSYLFPWVARRPRLFRLLSGGDRFISASWPFSRMGDHTLIVLFRTGPQK